MQVLTTMDRVGMLDFSPSPYPEGTAWDIESQFCLYLTMYVSVSAVISSSSSSPSSVEEGSSQTCVGVVPRDLSLYDILSGIR